MKLEQDVYMTPAEMAAFFRVDPKTITRWDKSGKLDGIIKRRTTLGGHRRFRKEDVLAWAAVHDLEVQ